MVDFSAYQGYLESMLHGQKQFHFTGKSDVSCSMFCNVISLVLRDNDADSDIVSLIRLSVLNGQKTCSLNLHSPIGGENVQIKIIIKIDSTNTCGGKMKFATHTLSDLASKT